MAQERLTVKKIKEIMRLKHEAGLSNRAIAGACKISNSTVGEYLRRTDWKNPIRKDLSQFISPYLLTN